MPGAACGVHCHSLAVTPQQYLDVASATAYCVFTLTLTTGKQLLNSLLPPRVCPPGACRLTPAFLSLAQLSRVLEHGFSLARNAWLEQRRAHRMQMLSTAEALALSMAGATPPCAHVWLWGTTKGAWAVVMPGVAAAWVV